MRNWNDCAGMRRPAWMGVVARGVSSAYSQKAWKQGACVGYKKWPGVRRWWHETRIRNRPGEWSKMMPIDVHGNGRSQRCNDTRRGHAGRMRAEESSEHQYNAWWRMCGELRTEDGSRLACRMEKTSHRCVTMGGAHANGPDEATRKNHQWHGAR
jgi:hypothetical protein